ncbi:beta-1,4-glucuronyltransferase 1 isoform X3 [Halyomorpha halys]|uniref:beta-1,4-glucuronyltransferase 1 isoform X3 n=1 Tax=Halyomorpha halys TaxID=286706 RepID=UPI0006D4D2D8
MVLNERISLTIGYVVGTKRMLQRRTWLLRLSLILNLVVILYVGAHLSMSVHRSRWKTERLELAEVGPLIEGSRPGDPSRRILLDIGSQPTSYLASTNTIGTGKPTNSSGPSTTEHSTTQSVQATNIDCLDVRPLQRTAQRGDYWVLYNYILAERQFRCWESITYTTHADYTFLDNLEPLLDRWRGPISLALHAPSTDFNTTIQTIRYLRDCSPQPIAEYVTFHIYFPSKHMPKSIPRGPKVFSQKYNCSIPPPWSNPSSYKSQKKLLYPVNVGRNIARESATTYYVLASDIELYPSPGVIPDFLEMVRRQDPPLRHKNPKVFPLSIFEIEANCSLPNDKTELVSMLRNGSAIPFHKKVCPDCHNVPHSKEWANYTVGGGGLKVFHIGKRMGYHVHWEPIYIGTHADPLYDERLSWEGKSDKMTQGYALCVLDYEFQILDNAFLVHKPGIKTLKKDPARAIQAGKTNSLIRKIIFPELKVLYGTKKGCAV